MQNELIDQIAAALELPPGGDIVWYARHVRELCTARGQGIAELNDQLGEVVEGSPRPVYMRPFVEDTAQASCEMLHRGTIAHIAGIPVRLATDIIVDVNRSNWALIIKAFAERPGLTGATPTCGEHTLQVESGPNPCTCTSNVETVRDPQCPYHGENPVRGSVNQGRPWS